MTRPQQIDWLQARTSLVVKDYINGKNKSGTGNIMLFFSIINQAFEDLHIGDRPIDKINQACAKRYLQSSRFETHADHCGLDSKWIQNKLKMFSVL